MKKLRGVVIANSVRRIDHPSFSRRHAPELVCVANKPIIFHALEALREAGIDEAVLIVHPDSGEEIREAVGDGSGWGLSVCYLPRPPLGVVDGLREAAAVLGRAPVLVYPGNGIMLGPSRALVARWRRSQPSALVLLGPGGSDECFAADGPAPVARATPGRASSLLSTGVCLIGEAAHDVISRTEPSWRGRPELADVIRDLLEVGQSVEMIEPGPHIGELPGHTWWEFHGRASELLEGNRMVLDRLGDQRQHARILDSVIEGRVAISATATIESTIIRGPAVIGAGAQLLDARIGPYTAVGSRSIVRGVEVEDSIIMAGAVLADLTNRIERSVIGEDATLNREFAVRRVLGAALAHGTTATEG